VTHVIEHFLDPTFADSRFVDVNVGGRYDALVLIVGAVASLVGIALAFHLYVRAPGTTLRLAERFRGLHQFLFRKWYFDELYDALFVRPARAFGSWAQNVFERNVIGGMVGGTTFAVRVGNSLVRITQTGLLRYYALLLLVGLGGLALYFLVVSS
jgi:NADH-quinone oxidoreductase subunit L